MAKSPQAFRTISEAADEIGVPQHVLRFWETKFSFIDPLKRAGGRRFYRPQDIAVLKGVKRLLHQDGLTIKGVQKILKDQGARHVAAIGSGGPVEALPPPTPDLPEDDVAQPAIAAPAPPVRDENFTPPSGIALSGAARDRLAAVLRDLLECKRMLERAREN